MKSRSIIVSAILSLSLMLMTACSEDIGILERDGDSMVSFKVSMPRELGTRAEGVAASHINTLEWSLFEVRPGGERHLVYTESRPLQDLSQVENVELNLVKGGSYKVTFCAYDSDGRSFANCEDGIVSVDYTAAGSNQAGDDIFVGSSETFTAENEKHEEPVTLHRPFAQLNWASSDLDAATVTPYLNGTIASVTVKTGLYTTLDLFTGEVSGEVESPVSFPVFECDNLNNGSFETGDNSRDYKLLAMNYLLTGADSSTINCEMNFSGKVSLTASVENASVAPNFRTNIYGSLISDPATLLISTARSFADDRAMIDHPYSDIVEKIVNGDDVEIPEGTTVDLYGLGVIQIHDGQTIIVNGTLLVGSEQLKLSNGKEANICGTGMIRSQNESVKWLVSVYSGSTINISGISLHNDGVSTGSAIYIDSATANVDGVSITGNSFGVNCQKNAILNISNSYISTSFHIIDNVTYRGRPIHVQNGSEAYIKDCTLDANLGICVDNARCVIDGGTYTTNKIEDIKYNHPVYLYENGDVIIKDGEFKSCTSTIIYNHTKTVDDVVVYCDVSCLIEGGHFNNNINETDNIRLADGLQFVEDADENGNTWYYVRPIE